MSDAFFVEFHDATLDKLSSNPTGVSVEFDHLVLFHGGQDRGGYDVFSVGGKLFVAGELTPGSEAITNGSRVSDTVGMPLLIELAGEERLARTFDVDEEVRLLFDTGEIRILGSRATLTLEHPSAPYERFEGELWGEASEKSVLFVAPPMTRSAAGEPNDDGKKNDDGESDGDKEK